MSKLIYSPTSTLMEDTYQNIRESDQTTNGAYFSIGFTGDGYMYTHGKKFRLFQIINNTLSGFTFSVSGGTAQLIIDGTTIGQGTVVQSINNDTIINATTTNGVVTLSHKQYLNEGGQYGSATKIPIVTVDNYGHISAISQSSDLDLTKVVANAVSDIGNYYLTGVTDNTAQNPIYSTSAYIDSAGNIHGNNFYLNGEALSTLFAPLDHVEQEATSTTIGHVKLYDSADATKGVDSAFAATPNAVYQALSLAKAYADDLVTAQDSMIFVGTIDSTGIIRAHNANILTATDDITNVENTEYKVGWTFRFTTSGTFNGKEVEPGDILIAVESKNTDFDINDWTIIQNNISGALTSTNNLNGLLYASNSRNIQSIALQSGVVTSNGSTLSFVNPNTLWRTIKINNTSIESNELNLKEGTNVRLVNNNGEVTIGVSSSDIIGSSSSLTFTKDLVQFEYNPSGAANLNIGGGLELLSENNAYTLDHISSNISINNKLGSITIDSYGHVTGFTEVTSLKNPNSITIRDENTEHIVYDGSVAKILKILNGTDINLTLAAGVDNDIVLTPSITHKYRPISFYPTLADLTPTVLIANNASTTFTLVGGDNVTLTNLDDNGNPLDSGILKINAEDTWRAILAYKFAGGEFSRSSIGSGSLKFSNDFMFASDEIGLCWTEIDSEGRVTYVN